MPHMERKTPKFYLAKANKFLGARFNKLVVIEITSERSADRHIIVKCICDCGNSHLAKLSLLKRGVIQSCGCFNIESANNNLLKAKAVQFKREPKLATAKVVYNNGYNDGDISFEEFLKLSQQNCFYCGSSPSNIRNIYTSPTKIRNSSPDRIRDGYFSYNGLDRIDNNLGHLKNNCVPCCWNCNSSKLKRTQDEFIAWAHAICKLHPIVK